MVIVIIETSFGPSLLIAHTVLWLRFKRRFKIYCGSRQSECVLKRRFKSALAGSSHSVVDSKRLLVNRNVL